MPPSPSLGKPTSSSNGLWTACSRRAATRRAFSQHRAGRPRLTSLLTFSLQPSLPDSAVLASRPRPPPLRRCEARAQARPPTHPHPTNPLLRPGKMPLSYQSKHTHRPLAPSRGVLHCSPPPLRVGLEHGRAPELCRQLFRQLGRNCTDRRRVCLCRLVRHGLFARTVARCASHRQKYTEEGEREPRRGAPGRVGKNGVADYARICLLVSSSRNACSSVACPTFWQHLLLRRRHLVLSGLFSSICYPHSSSRLRTSPASSLHSSLFQPAPACKRHSRRCLWLWRNHRPPLR